MLITTEPGVGYRWNDGSKAGPKPPISKKALTTTACHRFTLEPRLNALDVVLARAQPGYQAGVEKIVDRLRTTFGPGRYDGLAVEQLADILMVCAL